MLGEEISFEQRSFHSDENLDLPELVDESYMVSSVASRDLHTEHGRDSITDYSEASRDLHAERDYSDYSDSRISHQGQHDYKQTSYHRDDYRDYTDTGDYRHDDRSYLPDDYTRPELNLDLGLLRQKSDDLSGSGNDEKTVLERLDTVGPLLQREHSHEPKIEGDSLFTQDEPLPVTGGHSLVEFEELEAVVQTHLDQPDNLDLIGAYLQGLESQEAEEDSGNNSEEELPYSPEQGDQGW